MHNAWQALASHAQHVPDIAVHTVSTARSDSIVLLSACCIDAHHAQIFCQDMLPKLALLVFISCLLVSKGPTACAVFDSHLLTSKGATAGVGRCSCR